MAVDSRDKRGSVLGLILGVGLVLPNPDGAALDQGDRQQVAFSYRGIAATTITLPSYTYTATWQQTATYSAGWQATSTYTAEWQQTSTYNAEWD